MGHEDLRQAPDRGYMRPRINLVSFLLAVLATILSMNGTATAQGCGPIGRGGIGTFGPFDYRTERNSNLTVVEEYHFTPEVENLIKGNTGTIGGDLSYTLVTFPNHHRALIAMMRLGEKQKTPQPAGSRYSVECWFERAVRFRPDDVIVRMIYSTYLNRHGRLADANRELKEAANYAKDDAFAHYNIGLHYFDLKNYDQALAEAHKASALGFTPTALRDKLISVGKWIEPTNTPAMSAADAASAPAPEAK